MDHTPRALFALTLAGLRDEALHSNTPWMCLSCYFCAVRCPKGIRIPDVMYAIKAIAIHEGIQPEKTGSDFSHTFVANIERYGRSHEMGLVARHYLRHYPLRLPGLAPIRGLAGLRAILDRAAQLERAERAA
jgi:heterodisulfide reductase subunit C